MRRCPYCGKELTTPKPGASWYCRESTDEECPLVNMTPRGRDKHLWLWGDVRDARVLDGWLWVGWKEATW